MVSKTAVIALGGNAISPKSEADTIANQFRRTRNSLESVVHLIRQGYNLAITHGNGPQVGNALLRVELSRGKAPALPLGICVADTEGGMGYMIEQSLQNRFRMEHLHKDVVTIVTQVLVDKSDPSITNPSKFIGQFYDETTARHLEKDNGWILQFDTVRDGWRRVVPSPVPLEILNHKPIRQLVESGTVVVAAGGGGIPVYVDNNGNYEGMDAVIDKDRAAAILARDIHAEELFILTDVPEVFIHYGTPNQHPLREIHLDELIEFNDNGQFPPGSMGPKIEAAITFLKNGGSKVIVTSIELLHEALQGKRGTQIVQ